jgi:hypothetical protein
MHRILPAAGFPWERTDRNFASRLDVFPDGVPTCYFREHDKGMVQGFD